VTRPEITASFKAAAAHRAAAREHYRMAEQLFKLALAAEDRIAETLIGEPEALHAFLETSAAEVV
jgi:hypothetical protein